MLFLLLVIVSFYAALKTMGATVLIVPLILFSGIILFSWDFKFELKIVLNYLPVALLIWLFFYGLLYGFDGSMRIPHEDYISYSRYAYYNDQYGVENIGSYYNALTKAYPEREFYHVFELWMSSFVSALNGQSRFVNQYLVTFPLLTFLLYVGLHQLIETKGIRFYVPEKSHWIAFLALIVFFTNRNLYSSLMQLLDRSTAFQLPLNQINYLKLLPVALILLVYFHSMSAPGNRSYEQIGICFLYLPVLPVFAMVYLCSEIWSHRFRLKPLLSLIIAVFASGMYVFIFYKSVGYKGLNAHLQFNWIRSVQIMDFMKAAGKVVLIYIVGYAVPLFLYVKFHFYDQWKKTVVMLICLLLAGVAFLAFQKYVFDMNQMLYNLAEPMIALISSVTFVTLWNVFKRKIVSVAYLLVMCLPGFSMPVQDYMYELPQKRENLDLALVQFVKDHSIKSILVLPNRDSINGTLQSNERLTNQFAYLNCFNEQLNLVNTTLSFPLSKMLNAYQLGEIGRLRMKSPIYAFTSRVSEQPDQWLLPIMNHYSIHYVLSSKPLLIKDLHLYYQGKHAYLYKKK
jgi:hypothetical protein